MIFDYATLKVIWWYIVGGIIVVFALTDGWDLGIGMLSPFLGKSDDERRIILRSIEPNWEGNQTWLVIAGGVLFAAWPLVYAASFSGMYVAILLVLFSLFFRPVGFKYRNKVADLRWRTTWDWGLLAASCPRSCSASHSATSCKVCRSISMLNCVHITREPSGSCSIPSPCWPA